MSGQHRAGVGIATLAALALALGACGDQARDGRSDPGAGAPAPLIGDGSEPTQVNPTPTDDGNDMQIHFTLGDHRFAATLDDSAAADDLLAQLPVTVHMTDHGGVEKTGPLPSPLSLDGQPDGADPDVGDLGYYAPGNDLVLYHGDQSYFPGIVVLGRLERGAAEQIARMDGPVTVTVEAG
nr:cyclophilin-like fold protein [uncultured Nocardioides sp.]